jgi:hypothetical protein
VAERKPFLLRIDREILEAVQRWADDDLRSLNGQIEFILRKALSEAKKQSMSDARKESVKDAKRGGREGTGDEPS